jgi:hypothetical protein
MLNKEEIRIKFSMTHCGVNILNVLKHISRKCVPGLFPPKRIVVVEEKVHQFLLASGKFHQVTLGTTSTYGLFVWEKKTVSDTRSV